MKMHRDRAFMVSPMISVSIVRPNSSGISMASNVVCISPSAPATSMLALPLITPALCCITCWDTSKTAITIVKVCVTKYTATVVLKIHLKNINVSTSCMLFFSIII